MRCCRHCLFASGRFGVDGSMRAALLSIAFILVTLGVQLASGQGSDRWPQFRLDCRRRRHRQSATYGIQPLEGRPMETGADGRPLVSGRLGSAHLRDRVRSAGRQTGGALSIDQTRGDPLAPRRSCGADRKRSRREQPGDRHAGRRRRECLCVPRRSRRAGARSRRQGTVVRAPVAAQDLVRQRHLSGRVG